MKKPRKRSADLSLPHRIVWGLFLPFLILHFACLIPVVERSCLCPEDDPHWNCCCNCPKCVKRRGGFESYCHLRPHQGSEAEMQTGILASALLEESANDSVFKVPYVSLETLSCDCNSHIKRFSLDFKPFLPTMKIPGVVPVPVAAIRSSDDRRPPEAIPCQPEVPG